MKRTVFILIVFAAGFVALFEQSKAKPNVIIMVVAIAVFMLGLMQLMSKVPRKDQETNDENNENV